MLFLGAGASKPLGIPTMEDFTDVILKDLSTKGGDFDPFVRGIQSQISKFGLKSDIEAVLTVLEGKTRPRRALEDIGASVILFAEQYRNLAEDALASVATTEIEEAIYQRCIQVNHKKAIQLLGQLWDKLYSNLTYRESNSNYSIGPETLRNIFTTNYDLAIETFLKSRNYGFDDGFHQDTVGDAAFDGSWIQDPVHLFKLHGSVNYFVKEDGKVVRSDAPLGDRDFYGRPVKGRRMIYPTGEKYATRSPYYEYLGQLRRTLFSERVCIVIGYSFRDVPINNAFLDAIQKNSRLRILLVSPGATLLRDGLDEGLQRNILALNGTFGDDTLPQTVLETVQRWPSPWPVKEGQEFV